MGAPGHGIELSAGDEFAGYRIERSLGRGGMGMLYLALEPGLERRVALKLIAPEAAADEVFARRFAEESKIAASIEHPNVVPIYAAGEEGSVPFIAMRYVPGSDLARRLAREGRLEPALAVELVAQIGNGLDAIHAVGLVHRDVKPANVLLGGSDEAQHAYITDFGVARNVATESGLTQTGRFVGTLDYVAPEQISGGLVDARADVYALGCLLFKLLTGEIPFPKDGEAARLYAHLNDPPPAPSLYVAGLSMALDDVVARAMSKAPEDRYLSAGDLGRAAQAALRGEQPTLPEQTVAIGAAATRTAETVSAGPQDGATRPLRSEPSSAVDRSDPPGSQRHRRSGRWPLIAGALALVAAVVIAVVTLAGEGGGKDEGSAPAVAAGSSSAGASASRGRVVKPSEARRPATLSRHELITQADAICADSQATYLATRQDFPAGEVELNLTYAKILAGISTRAVRRFNALAPPASLREPYREYVAAQERVKAYDRQALAAAEAGDAAAYLAARERRDDEASERYDMAHAVGLQQCSAKRT
jgi:serine/threonine protein kinase